MFTLTASREDNPPNIHVREIYHTEKVDTLDVVIAKVEMMMRDPQVCVIECEVARTNKRVLCFVRNFRSRKWLPV